MQLRKLLESTIKMLNLALTNPDMVNHPGWKNEAAVLVADIEGKLHRTKTEFKKDNRCTKGKKK